MSGAADDVFADRTAIITGGASGIGRALGAELIRRGARVVLADINEDALEATAAELAAALPATDEMMITARPLDVRDAKAVEVLVEEVAAWPGGLDYLFNNAGVGLGGPTHEIPAADWDHVLDVNLRGVINGVLAAYPVMIRQGRGHIVNTASGAGITPAVLNVAYGTSKHAVVGLGLSLRPEAAELGVKVTTICPGAVDTPILDVPMTHGSPPTDGPDRSADAAATDDTEQPDDLDASETGHTAGGEDRGDTGETDDTARPKEVEQAGDVTKEGDTANDGDGDGRAEAAGTPEDVDNPDSTIEDAGSTTAEHAEVKVLTGRQALRRTGIRPIPPQVFARVALDGVARNKALVAAPRGLRILWYVHRLAPSLNDRLGRWSIHRILRERPLAAPGAPER